jgi:hypothetical protein
LPFVIQIALRDSHRAGRFEDEVIFLLHLVRHEPIGDPARDDDVVLRAITELAENGLERSPSFEDKDHFVRAAILIVLKFAVGLLRPRPIGGHVFVEEHRDATGVEIAAPRNVRRLDVMMAQRTVRDLLRRPILD